MNLFDLDPRSVADTSREAFETIRPTLPARDLRVCLWVDDFCALTGHHDVTGGELAAWKGMERTSIRPALTRSKNAKWLENGPIRSSRVVGEQRCRGYRLAVPRAAILRALSDAK